MALRILVFDKCNAQRASTIVDPATGKVKAEVCGLPVYGIAPGIVQNTLCKEHFSELAKLTDGLVYGDEHIVE